MSKNKTKPAIQEKDLIDIISSNLFDWFKMETNYEHVESDKTMDEAYIADIKEVVIMSLNETKNKNF